MGATAEQREFFETNGYLVLPGALSDDELQVVRDAADRAEGVWAADPSRSGWRRERIRQIASIIEYDDVLLDLLEHPVVFPVMRDLVGDDIAMLFTDYYMSPPRTGSHISWHQDVALMGPYLPRSTMYVKAFFLLTDVSEENGPTAILPGSHRFPTDFELPEIEDPADTPNALRMTYTAGTVWLFNARGYHAAMPNHSDVTRRVLIYCYGHCWMKPWQGYEPSPALQEKAKTPMRQQLLHMREPYPDEYQKTREVPKIGGSSGQPV